MPAESCFCSVADEVPGISLVGLVLGAVLAAEASGISLLGLVLGAVLGTDGTGGGRWEKLSARPECQYCVRFMHFAMSEHTSAFAFALIFGFAFAYDIQVIAARVVTHGRR